MRLELLEAEEEPDLANICGKFLDGISEGAWTYEPFPRGKELHGRPSCDRSRASRRVRKRHSSWRNSPASCRLRERIDSATLIEAVNAHTVNMVATRVNWFDSKPELLSISYRIPLPPGTDEEEVARRIDAVLASETWAAVFALRTFHVVCMRHQTMRIPIRRIGEPACFAY